MSLVKQFSYILNRSDKRKIIFLLFLSFIGSLFELLGVSAILPMVNLIMNTNEELESDSLKLVYNLMGFHQTNQLLLLIIISVVVIYIAKNGYLIWNNKILYSYIYSSQEKLARKLLLAYMKEPYLFHLSKNTAELQRSINTDVIYFYIVVLHMLQLIVEVLVCVVLGLFLVKTSIIITFGVFTFAFLCIGSFYLLTKKTSKRIGKQNQLDNGKMIQWVNQSLGGIKEVKLLQREEFFEKQYASYYKQYADGMKKYNMIQATPKYIIEASCIGGLLSTIAFQIMNNVDAMKLIPQITVFAVAAFRLLPSVSKISSHVSTIIFYKPSVELVYNDLKEIDTIIENEKKEQILEINFKECVMLKNVSFKYPKKEEDVLRNVNLVIHRGESVGFIGPSGAGKTTLVDLMLGLIEPQKGNILVDGENIFDNVKSWYEKIGYVPQSIFLTDDSILKNIAFGVDNDKIDIEKVNKALKQAQLSEYVNSLEDGIYTQVGERGIRISGGQRQRIGIARALYNEPDILVMDEATSALDNETEEAVMEAIENLKGLKTMVIIAHRLNTIFKCDTIYEVKNGNVKKTKLDINRIQKNEV